MKDLKLVDNGRDEISIIDGEKEVRGWSYADETERRVKMLCAREYFEGYYAFTQEEPLKTVIEAQGTYENPIMQVAFRAGFIMCREYMARFVEQGGDATTAQSIRANWIPAFDIDPGGPRKLAFSEVASAPDMETGPWEAKKLSPSLEAATYALGVMNALGMSVPGQQ